MYKLKIIKIKNNLSWILKLIIDRILKNLLKQNNNNINTLQ